MGSQPYDQDTEYDADELWESTTIEDMRMQLEEIELVANVPPSRGGAEFTEWEERFVKSVREQFNTRVAEGKRKPLSGKQLLSLRKIWDKVA